MSNSEVLKFAHSFIIRRRSQYIFCFGAMHVYNPKHKQFPAIEKFWRKFLEATKGQKRIVFVEGGKRPLACSRREAIEKGGEGDFTVWLAERVGVLVDSPEPPRGEERRNLEKQFSREDIELYYFTRYAYQWNRFSKKPPFADYINSFLKQDKHQSRWKKFDFSLENIETIFRKKFSRPFKSDDKNFFYSIINPHYTKTVINKVSKASGEIRDAYITKNIIKQWNSGKSIFLVYGNGHIPALKKYLVNKIIKKL
ncbi:MAG: hypothetical protein HYV67_01025 [Candidatus Taylorbacteria bacterium]|nr:hypothetical protein [Candidatus Taylorbacteria bacterium]